MRSIVTSCVLLTALAFPAAAQQVTFPPGTVHFSETGASRGVPAAGGGVWVGTQQGLVRYTEAGAGAVIPTPGGGTPKHLVLAADGSIWFAANTLIARISTAGVVLEQYPISDALTLAVASDGALWYARALGAFVGRIAGGVRVEWPKGSQLVTGVWSLAPATNGDMWILGSGFATATDGLYRITPTGTITASPLGVDTLFGRLQTLPDGTLYIGTGFSDGRLFRLTPAGGLVEVTRLGDDQYLADDSGNVWTGGSPTLGYLHASGAPAQSVPMPGCSHRYEPFAIDTTGGLWVRVEYEDPIIGVPITCGPVPDLVRIDMARFLEAHVPGHTVPTLSPAMLVAMAAALALATFKALRV